MKSAVVVAVLSTIVLAAPQDAKAQGALGVMPKGTPSIAAPETSPAPETSTARQASSARQTKRVKPTRAAPKPLPVVIPQQFAPPQEEYASFPDTSAAAAAAAQPSACQVALAKVAEFKPLPVLVGPGGCGATDAVLMASIILPDQNKVAVSPPATLRCPMAQALADWVRDDVAPSLKKFGPPLHVLDNFDSYSCRGRNNIRAAQLSEHGKANAIDIRDFALADGRAFGLTDIHTDRDWREATRTSACARFATVLGPGSDGYHEQHIHLDLAERRNNYKLCEWDVRSPPPPPEAKAQGQEQEQGQKAQEGTPEEDAELKGDDEPAIPTGEVPLPRPRPRFASRQKSADH